MTLTCHFKRTTYRELPGGPVVRGLPRWLSDKESTCQCRRCRRLRFIPELGRKWQPAPVFLLGKSHGHWSLVGYSPWCSKESNTAEQLSRSACQWLGLCAFPAQGRFSPWLGNEDPTTSTARPKQPPQNQIVCVSKDKIQAFKQKLEFLEVLHISP